MTNGEQICAAMADAFINRLPVPVAMALDERALARLREDVKCAAMEAMATLSRPKQGTAS